MFGSLGRKLHVPAEKQRPPGRKPGDEGLTHIYNYDKVVTFARLAEKFSVLRYRAEFMIAKVFLVVLLDLNSGRDLWPRPNLLHLPSSCRSWSIYTECVHHGVPDLQHHEHLQFWLENISLKLLTSRPHIQLMSPQARLLLMKPNIRLTHRVSAHILPNPLILSIFIHNRTIANRMHNTYAPFAHLANKSLR
jgi:hypothetical protein